MSWTVFKTLTLHDLLCSRKQKTDARDTGGTPTYVSRSGAATPLWSASSANSPGPVCFTCVSQCIVTCLSHTTDSCVFESRPLYSGEEGVSS